jgi:inosine-uridine nucleoside N-ribohydrolase
VRKSFLVVAVLFIVVFCNISAKGTKDLHPLVIDTDCALDDMRALCILLSQTELRIAGIVVTEGTLLPAEGTEKVRALLHGFNRDTIPVTCGKTYNRKGPVWRDFNR